MGETSTDLYGELAYLDSALFQAVVAHESVDAKRMRFARGAGKFLDDTNALDLACDKLRKCGSDQAAQDYCLRQILGSTARFSFWGPEVRDAVRGELITGIRERLSASLPEVIQRLDVLTSETEQAVRIVTKGSE